MGHGAETVAETGGTAMSALAWTVNQGDMWTIIFCGAFVLLIWLLVNRLLPREQ